MTKYEERSVRVATTGLADLDEAMAWAVQTIERERLHRPEVLIRPITVFDDDGEHPEYEAHVDGRSLP